MSVPRPREDPLYAKLLESQNEELESELLDTDDPKEKANIQKEINTNAQRIAFIKNKKLTQAVINKQVRENK